MKKTYKHWGTVTSDDPPSNSIPAATCTSFVPSSRCTILIDTKIKT